MERTPWRIVISTARRTLTLFRAAKAVRTVSVVVGKPSTPTPDGLFAVWWAIPWHPDDFLGSWVLELTAHSDVLQQFDGGDGTVAIHLSAAVRRTEAQILGRRRSRPRRERDYRNQAPPDAWPVAKRDRELRDRPRSQQSSPAPMADGCITPEAVTTRRVLLPGERSGADAAEAHADRNIQLHCNAASMLRPDRPETALFLPVASPLLRRVGLRMCQPMLDLRRCREPSSTRPPGWLATL